MYVNEEDIRYLQKEQTPISPGDTVSIIPSVAGGTPTTEDLRGARLPPSPEASAGHRSLGGGGQADRELPQLTNDEIKRYSRHLIMPEVGMDGQRRLKAGKVLCIGAGGLGSPAAMYRRLPASARSASWTSMSSTSVICSARSLRHSGCGA